MNEAVDAPVERRGRKSTEEEVAAYLAARGITPERIEALKRAEDPQSFAEMLDLAITDVWANFKNLSATAKVAALKEIRALAKAEEGVRPGAEPEPLVADVIDGIVHLPAERKREILEHELVRVDEERARIVEVLAS